VDTVVDIFLYETKNGQVPFDEWFMDTLDSHTRARIETRIDRLSLGNFGNCNTAKEGVIELCIDFGPGYRIYFGREGNTIVILLGGGTKATQESDMRLARKYWREHKHAH
jgi:putative addiction module killer protein